MNRQTYWTYQLAGWSVFAAIGLVINVLNGGYLPSLIVGHVLLVFYGIGLTHLFRRLILGRQAPPAGRLRWLGCFRFRRGLSRLNWGRLLRRAARGCLRQRRACRQ
jgi:hypothetical protein